MATIEIDGVELEVESGQMVIEAADEAGIPIPRFCYHKKLSVAANCRMCLVELGNVRKPMPACATPVTDGMKVFTKSAMAIEAQKAVMEFLLINHPLDCPICDQGGECELQDISMGYGKDLSQYTEGKRSVVDDNLGSLISTEMTRCIHCTRCVRFGEEIAGVRELGATGRGEATQIGTYIEHSLVSEVSGNVIDLCPVGALTSKPYRFTARAWEMTQHQSISPHDCIGSNLLVHTRRNQVMRVVPNENEQLNETWISDRDRFSYPSLYSKDRLLQPMVKKNGQWQTVEWSHALDVAAAGIQKVLSKHGSDNFAGLLSSQATTEEAFLIQKLLRKLGVDSIDHRLHQTDFADQSVLPMAPVTENTLEAIEQADAILLLGSHIQREQPLAGLRVRKASLAGAKVMSLNVTDYACNFEQVVTQAVSPDELCQSLSALVRAVADLRNENIAKLDDRLAEIKVNDSIKSMATNLVESQRAVLILGAVAHNHPASSVIRSLVHLLERMLDVTVYRMTEGPNEAGCHIAGALPHRHAFGEAAQSTGKTVTEILNHPMAGYLLHLVEPEMDVANPQKARQSVLGAEFVVCLATHISDSMKSYADVILPVATPYESSGTYVNVTGHWQSFKGVAACPGEARPAWKVLRVLGNLLKLDGFDYMSSSDVLDDLKSDGLMASRQPVSWHRPDQLFKTEQSSLSRIAEWPMYRCDNMVRHGHALQASAANDKPSISVHPETAKAHQLQDTATVSQGDFDITLPLILDERMPLNVVKVDNGWQETVDLAQAFGPITLKAHSE